MKRSYFFRKNRYAAFLFFSIFLVILIGMFGYMLLEDIPPLEALFMAIGTLTTISPFTLSSGGKLFSILLLIFGFGLVAATAAYLGNLVLDENWIELYRRRKLEKRLKDYENHYIICGHGQMGQRIVAELNRYNTPIVIIDNDHEVLLRCKELGLPHLDKDAMEEGTLMEAGVEKAKGLISVVNRDADNVYIVLTARSLNPELYICARASSRGVESKLRRAGADRIVSPYATAAMRISQNILRPTVTNFLELALSGEGMELEMEELYIPSESDNKNAHILDSEKIRKDFDLIIVTIIRPDGKWIYNPPQNEPIQREDTIIALGPQTNMDKFHEYLYGSPRASLNNKSNKL